MADIIAKESEAAAIGGGTTNTGNKCATKLRALALGCIVKGTYADNQLTCLKDIKKAYKVYYTTTDNSIIPVDSDNHRFQLRKDDNTIIWGNEGLISNTYVNGQGVMAFKYPIVRCYPRGFKDNTTLLTLDISQACTPDASSSNYRTGNPGLNIGSNFCNGCEHLQTITLPSFVSEIDDYTFYRCFDLVNVLGIGTNLDMIWQYAFATCSKLDNLNFLNNNYMLIIGEQAFESCCSMDIYDSYEATLNLTINFCNKSVYPTWYDNDMAYYKIGSSAFSGCKKLRTLTVKGDIKQIMPNAFFNCSYLHTVDLSQSTLLRINDYAFSSIDNYYYYPEYYDSKVILPATLSYVVGNSFNTTYFNSIIANYRQGNVFSIQMNSMNSSTPLGQCRYMRIYGDLPEYGYIVYTSTSSGPISASNPFDSFPLQIIVEDQYLKNYYKAPIFAKLNKLISDKFFLECGSNSYTPYVYVDTLACLYNKSQYLPTAFNMQFPFVIWSFATTENNSYIHQKFTIHNNPNCKFYLNSFAESGYDYAIAWDMDYVPPESLPSSNSARVKYHTRTSGYTDPKLGLSSFIECSYPNDGNDHFVYISFRTDSSYIKDDTQANVLYPYTYNNLLGPEGDMQITSTKGTWEVNQHNGIINGALLQSSDDTDKLIIEFNNQPNFTVYVYGYDSDNYVSYIVYELDSSTQVKVQTSYLSRYGSSIPGIDDFDRQEFPNDGKRHKVYIKGWGGLCYVWIPPTNVPLERKVTITLNGWTKATTFSHDGYTAFTATRNSSGYTFMYLETYTVFKELTNILYTSDSYQSCWVCFYLVDETHGESEYQYWKNICNNSSTSDLKGDPRYLSNYQRASEIEYSYYGIVDNIPTKLPYKIAIGLYSDTPGYSGYVLIPNTIQITYA